MSEDLNKLAKYLKTIESLKVTIKKVIDSLDFANSQYTTLNNSIVNTTTIEEETALLMDCHDIRNEAANKALLDYSAIAKGVGDFAKEVSNDFPDSPITTELVNINAPIQSGYEAINRINDDRNAKFVLAAKTPDLESRLYQLELAEKKSKQIIDTVGNTLVDTDRKLDKCVSNIETVINRESSRDVYVGNRNIEPNNALILMIQERDTQNQPLYAKHAFLMDGPVQVETSSGRLQRGNEQGENHGTGDYIISKDMDFTDEWICNGVKFGDTYEVVKIPAIKFNDIDHKATCLKELYRYEELVTEEFLSQDGLLISEVKDPTTRMQMIAIEQNPDAYYQIEEASREAEELYRIKQEEAEQQKDCTEERESIGYVVLAGAIGISAIERSKNRDNEELVRSLI